MIVAKKGSIAAARCSLGMTQRALAKESGISQTRICKIESGGAPMRPTTAKKIGEAVGKNFNELFDVIPKKDD